MLSPIVVDFLVIAVGGMPRSDLCNLGIMGNDL